MESHFAVKTLYWRHNIRNCCYGRHKSKFPKYYKFMALKIVVILANDADSDETPLYAGFHLGLYYLTKIQNEKGNAK